MIRKLWYAFCAVADVMWHAGLAVARFCWTVVFWAVVIGGPFVLYWQLRTAHDVAVLREQASLGEAQWRLATRIDCDKFNASVDNMKSRDMYWAGRIEKYVKLLAGTPKTPESEKLKRLKR